MAFDIVSFYQDIILNRIVTAAIIFFIGFIIGKIAGNIIKKILAEVELNKKTVNTILGRINTEKFIAIIVSYTIYFATILMALSKLGITRYIIIGIILFFAFIIISTLLLDLKDALPNLYAWMMIKNKGYFDVDDKIKTHFAEGSVKKIGLLNTRIITNHGDELYVHNYSLLENLIVEKKHKKK